MRILSALKDIIFNFNINKLGGPVAIYNFSSQAAEQGLPAVLSLLAMLSLNIGISSDSYSSLGRRKDCPQYSRGYPQKTSERETETYITLSGVLLWSS